jgi:hypothetical protein
VLPNDPSDFKSRLSLHPFAAQPNCWTKRCLLPRTLRFSLSQAYPQKFSGAASQQKNQKQDRNGDAEKPKQNVSSRSGLLDSIG